MVYQIEIDSVAKRFLKKLPTSEYQVIRSDIDGLALNPRPEGHIKMTHAKNLFQSTFAPTLRWDSS